MSALRCIAWDMVDFSALTPKEFQDLRIQVRDELRHHTHLRLVAEDSNRFKLVVLTKDQRWSKRMRRYRKKAHHRGTLQSCCKVAFGLLYPEGTL